MRDRLLRRAVRAAELGALHQQQRQHGQQDDQADQQPGCAATRRDRGGCVHVCPPSTPRARSSAWALARSALKISTVRIPSLIASGTCVTAKIAANLTNEPAKPLLGSG